MTNQRRKPRVGVEDRWTRADRKNGKRVPSAKHGRGRRWRARWVESDGTEREKLFAKKTEAQTYIDNVTASVVSGDYVPPEGPETLLRVVAERWRAGLEVKESTRVSYESILSTHVLPHWGDVPLRGITPSGIRAWLQERQTGEKPVSSGYARKCGRVLSMVLSVAVGDRLIARSPMERIKLPKPDTPRRGNSLTGDQLVKLIKHMPNDQHRALTAVLGYCGLRWGEAIALRPDAVDFKRGRLHVRRTLIEIGGRVQPETPKSHESRWVPMPPFVADMLADLAVEVENDGLIFPNRAGGYLAGTNWLTRVYRPALTAAKVSAPEKRIIHDLRHTFASLAVKAGANIKQLQRAMGHASATITLDVYADLFEDDFSGLGDRLQPTAGQLRAMASDPEDQARR